MADLPKDVQETAGGGRKKAVCHAPRWRDAHLPLEATELELFQN